MASPHDSSRTSSSDSPTRTRGTKRSRRGPPRASRRSVFEIFHLALEEIDRLKGRGSYGDLPTFTQDWLKGKVSDYGNALSLMRTWGLLTRPGNLSPEFVGLIQEAEESQSCDDLRAFLREQIRTGYENLLDDPLQGSESALFEQLGEEGFDTRALQTLPGIAGEEDPQTRDKRQQCLAAVSDVIRYCHDRAILGKEAVRKASPLLRNTRLPDSVPLSGSTTPRSEITDSGLAVITQRVFNMRDESHKNRDAQVWFDVPATPYWVEQLGLRLLDWADQLREQERG